MLGMATESFLIKEGVGGPSNAPYPIHKVTIVPFAQEMLRDVSLWGQVFGFRRICGTVSANGISFSTRRGYTDSARSTGTAFVNLHVYLH